MSSVIHTQPDLSATGRPKCMPNPTIRWPGNPATLPRISIVTPCLNHAEYVEATLWSILKQGYPNLEYVVMDGGSTDGSARIIARYADYLTHWSSQPDAGQYEAIQAGFAKTTGEIMAWLNADDCLHHNALWTVAEIFRQFPQVSWLMGMPTRIDATGRVFCTQTVPRWSRYRYLKGDYRWIQQESVFWRRSLWEQAGACLNTRYKLAADLELWTRFFRHARLYTTPALIGGFRSVPGQRSQVCLERYLREAEQIITQEPHSAADRVVLRRLARFERLWLRLPLVKRSWRVRQAYRRLFDHPPIIALNVQSGEFELIEG